jgi:two-component system, chemotaxis family, response regulator Rcp1
MQGLNKKKINVLMVEDNNADVFLTQEILSESKRYSYNISAVKDGIEALAFLHKSTCYEHALRPDLIILDLNLPKMTGLEFLMEMRKDKALATLPVIFLTTAALGSDIEKSQELGVISYLVKPVDIEEFEAAVSDINIASTS